VIEVGDHPEAVGALIIHSTESGRFLPCERHEFEQLAAGIKRGEADKFLGMQERSFGANGDPDWNDAGLREERKRVAALLAMTPQDARPSWAGEYADLLP
jgi:hypothetical protein